MSPGLPPNQWQLEVRRWFETSLAKTQLYIFDFVSNTADLGPYGWVESVYSWNDSSGTRDALIQQCSNQRIQSAGLVQNFSFLGIMIVVCVSGLFIIVGLTLDTCVAFARAHKGKLSESINAKENARQADEKLHLLRMALQGAGVERWETGAWDIPVTAEEVKVCRPEFELGIVRYRSTKGLHKHDARPREDGQGGC